MTVSRQPVKQVSASNLLIDLLFDLEFSMDDVTLVEAVNLFYEHRRFRPPTERKYRQSTRQLSLFFEQHLNMPLKPIHQILRIEMVKFSDWLTSPRDLYGGHFNRPAKYGVFAPKTAHTHWVNCKSFFKWCATYPMETISDDGEIVTYTLIKRNPMDYVEGPMMGNRTGRAIAVSDLRKMLDAAREYPYEQWGQSHGDKLRSRNFAIMHFLASTGCRAESISKLRVCDVHFRSRDAIVTLKEKGRRGVKKERSSRLYEHSALALRDWLENHHPDPQPDNPLFTPVRFGKVVHMNESAVRKLCKTLAKFAGVTGVHNPHSIRHRAITEFQLAGQDAASSSKFAGHADIGTTQKNYVHLPSDRIIEIHEKSKWF